MIDWISAFEAAGEALSDVELLAELAGAEPGTLPADLLAGEAERRGLA